MIDGSSTFVLKRARRNRNQLAIIADILKATRINGLGRKKTQIMQSANLSTGLANKYLDLLLRNGYVMLENGNKYRVSRKGLDFLNNLQAEDLRSLQFRR